MVLRATHLTSARGSAGSNSSPYDDKGGPTRQQKPKALVPPLKDAYWNTRPRPTAGEWEVALDNLRLGFHIFFHFVGGVKKQQIDRNDLRPVLLNSLLKGAREWKPIYTFGTFAGKIVKRDLAQLLKNGKWYGAPGRVVRPRRVSKSAPLLLGWQEPVLREDPPEKGDMLMGPVAMEAMEALPYRNKLIVERLLGLNGPAMTLAQVAKSLIRKRGQKPLTRERIAQLYEWSIKRLREAVGYAGDRKARLGFGVRGSKRRRQADEL